METELHCGACMQNFNSQQELTIHLSSCPESTVLLPIINSIWFGSLDKTGHPAAHFIMGFHKATRQNLIKRYAYAVADDLNTLERAKLHAALCACIDIDYNQFRPFESEQIRKIPSRNEALIILCDALLFEGLKHLKEVENEPTPTIRLYRG